MRIEKEIGWKMILTHAHTEYNKGLVAHALFKLNDKHLCEDLVQDTFLKACIYLAKGEKINNMKAFLYHILNNLIIDEYRKHKTVSLDELMAKGFEPSIGDFESSISKIDSKLSASLIELLPMNYKKIINMRYLEELTLKEISQFTNQSKNNIAVQIHRGIDRLKLLQYTYLGMQAR